MNRIFQTQLANQTFLICLQNQPQLFQYIPQIYYGDIAQLNTGISYIQQCSNYNGTNINEQQYQNNLQQAQVLEQPLYIKNETEREISENKLNSIENPQIYSLGHWSKEEHELYLEFIDTHYDILKSKYDKKSKKIFKMMSQYISSRNPTQCRSHHQKFNPLQQNKRKKKFKVEKY
ncbi:unnamed protein product [Paramecium sonneborni]|uniref:Myb-like domain-containing protein n=1 Tax=Paramecium sonneborni TaxID=65129 RepID=A0A8S1RBS7_9CILI|nr:unnamed protein product [Paramecium sonneborni]